MEKRFGTKRVLSNLANITISVSPRAIIYELTPVTIEEEVFEKMEEETLDLKRKERVNG